MKYSMFSEISSNHHLKLKAVTLVVVYQLVELACDQKVLGSTPAPPILAIVKFVRHRHTQKKESKESNDFSYTNRLNRY